MARSELSWLVSVDKENSRNTLYLVGMLQSCYSNPLIKNPSSFFLVLKMISNIFYIIFLHILLKKFQYQNALAWILVFCSSQSQSYGFSHFGIRRHISQNLSGQYDRQAAFGLLCFDHTTRIQREKGGTGVWFAERVRGSGDNGTEKGEVERWVLQPIALVMRAVLQSRGDGEGQC